MKTAPFTPEEVASINGYQCSGDPIHLAITGSRLGTTSAQRAKLQDLLTTLRPCMFRHGACVGVDEEAVLMVSMSATYPVHIIAHPGRSAKGGENELLSQIALEHSHEVLAADTHFARNRTMVDLVSVVVGCPATMEELTHGGTWFTINYARKKKKQIYICWPDGSMTEEGQ